ncbi:MAG TPA: OmpA family protein [Povalibacter sp.]|nr:OmpA family protein [Povalibacter sp.]
MERRFVNSRGSKAGSLGVAAMLVVFVTGCTTVNPYTHEEQTSKAVKGAGIGAAAGAVVGLLTKGDKLQNALIGAGVGAIAGGGVGYYMDVQEAKLRQKLEGTGVSVTRMGDNITLNMPSSITFALNSADLNAQFYNALEGVGMVLKEYDKTLIEVAGHTDSTGTEQYNQALSERRAQSVVAYLGSHGVKTSRLMTVGAGEAHPVASNDTEQGKAANRRVEMTIVPVTKG